MHAFMNGRPARRLLLPLLLVLANTAAGQALPATAPQSKQAAAVAQVVLGILSYSRWPVEPETVRLCVLGATSYTDGLLDGGTQSSGLPVRARRMEIDSAELGAACEAVYIGATSQTDRQRIFDRIAGHAVVSISESDPDCAVGSMFCLDVRATQVGFKVNLDSVARSGVRIHPSVLQLARRKPLP